MSRGCELHEGMEIAILAGRADLLGLVLLGGRELGGDAGGAAAAAAGRLAQGAR